MMEREVLGRGSGAPWACPGSKLFPGAWPPHDPLVAFVISGKKGPFWNPVAVVGLSREPVCLSQIRVCVPIWMYSLKPWSRPWDIVRYRA